MIKFNCRYCGSPLFEIVDNEFILIKDTSYKIKDEVFIGVCGYCLTHEAEKLCEGCAYAFSEEQISNIKECLNLILNVPGIDEYKSKISNILNFL
jgi:hypothetical protein